MAGSHVISGLIAKRSELAGNLQRLDTDRKTLKDQIEHVDQVLAIFGYNGDPKLIGPVGKYDRLFNRGELKRLVGEILRTSDGPLTNREITIQIIQKRGWDAGNENLIERVTDSVRPARRGLERLRS